jgi:GAF domain-containing protein
MLKTSEVVRALAYLNARTRFRFTGIYRVEPPMLRNVHLFDRENPTLNVSGNTSRLDDTYCSITSRTPRGFTTPDAGSDRRLEGHAARDSVISYCGVPIRMEDGRVWGTLCHFDVRPRLIPVAEVPVLESVVTLFAEWIQKSRE